MTRQVLYIALFLLLAGLAFPFIPKNSEKSPERHFLDLALACNLDFRPAMEEALLSPYNIWKIDETCEESSEEITSEVRSGAIHVLRSNEHGYEIVFTPRVVGDRVEWSCESTVQITSKDCSIDT